MTSLLHKCKQFFAVIKEEGFASLPARGEGVLGKVVPFGSGRGTSTTACGSSGSVLERDFRGRVFAPDASDLCLASVGSGEVRPTQTEEMRVFASTM